MYNSGVLSRVRRSTDRRELITESQRNISYHRVGRIEKVDLSKTLGSKVLPADLFRAIEHGDFQTRLTVYDIEWPKDLREIRHFCFDGSRLLIVDLRSTNLTVLDGGAFSRCDLLRRFYGPGTLSRVGDACFCGSGLELFEIMRRGGSLIFGAMALACTPLKSVIAPGKIVREDCPMTDPFGMASSLIEVELADFGPARIRQEGCDGFMWPTAERLVYWGAEGRVGHLQRRKERNVSCVLSGSPGAPLCNSRPLPPLV
jgi:hypothetical protein